MEHATVLLRQMPPRYARDPDQSVQRRQGMTDIAYREVILAYNKEAERLAAHYNALNAGPFRSTFADLLAERRGRAALDIGAGSGRDAAWLAGSGFNVVAVEPAAGMRRAAERLHARAAIRWIDDRLPGLANTLALQRRSTSFSCQRYGNMWRLATVHHRSAC